MLFALINFFFIIFLWSRDIVRERTGQGCHTLKVQKLIKFGISLFILSEVIFFFSFFWAFFDYALNPSLEIGCMWPPKGVVPLNPMHVPLLNSLILVSSGLTITRAHIFFINSNKRKAMIWTSLTVILGIYFTILQILEYKTTPFSFTDSAYGSIFFLTTGFHGFHVIIGTILILVSLVRMYMNHFSRKRHLNFEMACWYWHFVDFVWLFLYISIYWWGY